VGCLAPRVFGGRLKRYASDDAVLAGERFVLGLGDVFARDRF
jgi:hypothetical protein